MVKKKTSRKENIFIFLSLGIVLFALCLLSLRYGSAYMTGKEFVNALFDVKRKTPYGIILYSVRLPRTLAGVVSGASLAVSGALLQRITNNKMASPGLIGVNSGAGFAVIISLYFFPKLFSYIPLFAFVGAFLSTLFIVALSKKAGFTKGAVVLTGLALNAVLSSGISFFSMLDSDILVSYNAFSVGSLASVKMSNLFLPCIMSALSFAFAIFLSEKIDMLLLGDDVAKSIGVGCERVRLLAMLASSVLGGSAVSFAGLLGFVGLMAPHIASRFVRANTRPLLVLSALVGSILVLLADLLGRVLFSPGEMPVGILMSLIGAPFFIILLLFSKGGK